MIALTPEGGLPLVLARAAAVTGELSLLGVLTFSIFVAPRALARADAAVGQLVHAGLAGVARMSAAAALAGAAWWLAAEASDLAGTWRAFPAVLTGTAFGHVLALQLIALAGASLVLAGRDRPARRYAAFACALAAVTLQAGHSHALSMDPGPSVLLLSDLIHLWAASAWLGGLVPLLLVVGVAPARIGAMAARWYSPLGKACVIALILTAAYQGWALVGSVPGLVGTAYGGMALVKLVLLGALFAFAVVNRYRLAPALLRATPDAARRTLVRSIAAQTAVGLAIVVAAALLSQLPPALHEQPVWPFAVQPSLVTVDEDPEFKRMVVVALLELGGAAAVLACSLALRRSRIAAVVVSVVIGWVAIPDLRLLFVPATPTSFYRSPTGFAATSIVQGAALFAANCAACHGAAGRGDGPLAGGLSVPPADLTASHLWAHADGELFGWLTDGIEAPDGSPAMPGFPTLTPDDRWALIDFVRANNAGIAKHDTGAWPMPVAAPELTATCADGRTLTLQALRGRPVRLVFAGGVAATDSPALTTITIGPAPTGCAAADPAVARAYAIVLGAGVASLAGAELLIDPNGWLRSEAPGAIAPSVLAALVDEICTHPLAGGSGGHHHAE